MASAPRDLVLLHGWGMTTRVWEPVVPALSASYRVHNLSLPGYEGGFSGLPVAREDDAGTPSEVLDHWSDACLAASPPGAVWVAWSLGGLVALNASLRVGDAIRGLVLVSATPKFMRGPDWDAGIEPELLGGFLKGIQNGESKILKRFVALQAGASDDARGLVRLMSRCLVGERTSPGVLTAGLRVLETVDLRPRLADVRVPVRVIHGVGDRLVPCAAGAYLADRVPDGDLVRLDTGHAPFITQSAAFAAAVQAWM